MPFDRNAYLRAWRKGKRKRDREKAALNKKRAWFPIYENGEEYSCLLFIRDIGGPDSTQLGSSLRDLVIYGRGAQPLSTISPLDLDGYPTLRGFYPPGSNKKYYWPRRKTQQALE